MRSGRTLFKRLLPAILIGVLATSCSEAPNQPVDRTTLPPPSHAVYGFIGQSGVPNLVSIAQYFIRGDVEIFLGTYGVLPRDCHANCIYSYAWGLRLASKNGWMKIDDDTNSGYAPESSFYFDVTPADSALSDSVLWAAMDQGSGGGDWFWGMFLPMMAPDPDTPRPALLRLTHMLYGYISDYVADRLLDNPKVRTDHEILLLLANLPVFQGDAYAPIRARAQGYLSQLHVAQLSIER